MKWLQKVFNGSSAILEHTKPSINERFFCIPYLTNWLVDNNPPVFTHLPGDLVSLNQIDQCAPDDSRILSHDVFSTKVDVIDPDSPSLPGNSYPVRVSWLTRCMLTASHPWMDNESFALVIAWLQQHWDARIWTECLPIIPVFIMRDLSTMQFLFHEYCNTKMLGLDDPYSLFHPGIDNARFMDASIPIMRFIWKARTSS